MKLLYRYWANNGGNFDEHLILYKEDYKGFLCISPDVKYKGIIFTHEDMKRNPEFKECTDGENELIKGVLGMVDEWWKHAEETYIKHGLQLLQICSLSVEQIVEMLDDLYHTTANIYQ